ncbi:UV-induced protein uvi15 [Spatholobus suberectus]|nr:UV-induced protein uvi15 [Spatholobus suberectus]
MGIVADFERVLILFLSRFSSRKETGTFLVGYYLSLSQTLTATEFSLYTSPAAPRITNHSVSFIIILIRSRVVVKTSSTNMSYYDHQQQPPVGVPPPQGYPGKDPYPPPGYPAQGYPPQGYPPQGYAPQYVQQQPPPRKETGILEGCLAALCCCCLLDACF